MRILWLCVLLVISACARRESDSNQSPARQAPAPVSVVPPPPAAPAPKRPYNVILILIDALRADMPWTGYPRDIAPRLSAFAKQATLYPRAYSLSSYTAKSVVPALAGKYPSELQRDGYFFTRWLDENVLITERAQQAGHRSLAGHAHGYFLPRLGAAQGFDDYRLLPGTFLDTKGVFDVNSDRLNELAKAMLSEPKNVARGPGKRFFAYFHFTDPHYEYKKHDGHPDFGNGRRDRYDNEVHFTDHWVADLIDFVRSQPWSEQTAIIVSADHGEGFGEHNHYRHAYELWEALVRVPLIIQVPGAPVQRIEEPRSHIDLAPTIADLMGIRASEPWRGQSLVPELFGGAAPPRPVLVDLPRCDLMDRRRAFIDGDYKLLSFGDDGLFNFYNVKDDFKEERDLAKIEPERFAAMKQRYLSFAARIPTVPITGDAPLKGAPPGRRF